MVLEGSPELVLPSVVERYGIEYVTTSFTAGWYESQGVGFLEEKLPVPLEVFRGNTLFNIEQLPFAIEDLPTFGRPAKVIRKSGLASSSSSPGGK